MHTDKYMLYTLRCMLYIVHSKMYSIQWILCTLGSMQHILYIVDCIFNHTDPNTWNYDVIWIRSSKKGHFSKPFPIPPDLQLQLVHLFLLLNSNLRELALFLSCLPGRGYAQCKGKLYTSNCLIDCFAYSLYN